MSNAACDLQARSLQKYVFETVYGGRAVNSFRPAQPPQCITLPNGTIYHNDICYGHELSN